MRRQWNELVMQVCNTSHNIVVYYACLLYILSNLNSYLILEDYNLVANNVKYIIGYSCPYQYELKLCRYLMKHAIVLFLSYLYAYFVYRNLQQCTDFETGYLVVLIGSGLFNTSIFIENM